MTDTRPPLPPIIAAQIDRFTGRTWLAPPLLDWLEHGNQRILLLTGGPGTGKSMLSAWLAGFGRGDTLWRLYESIQAVDGSWNAQPIALPGGNTER